MSSRILTSIICCKFKNKAIKIIKPSKLIKMSNKIPSSLKHNVWTTYIGEKFDGKCAVIWCNNRITPFTFEAGHNIPFSKGGATTIDNLRPICSDCNKSMGNRYTIDEFSEQYRSSKDTDKQKIIEQRITNIDNDLEQAKEQEQAKEIHTNTHQIPVEHINKPRLFNKIFSFVCMCFIPKRTSQNTPII